ncbi:hypothetical protein GCM10025734_01180 [Kitasatospora paranensis]|uniref:hypothetical protein n=1 Tax=Kitasatospora paranensis TaxID=258053 RepID=UPI0031ECDB9E
MTPISLATAANVCRPSEARYSATASRRNSSEYLDGRPTWTSLPGSTRSKCQGAHVTGQSSAVLERFASAVSRAGADLDPTDGYLGGVGWETRYRLDGYVLLGARRTQQPITLTPTETLTLGTIGALALALPAAAMFDPTDLARLCAVLDDAVTHAPNPEPAPTPPT